MKARQQRMIFIGAVVVAMVGAGALAFRAFNENLLYFYSPTQVVSGEAPQDRRFRLGGLVLDGSFHRTSGSLKSEFVVTDLENNVSVEYEGVFPDLFEEGKGVVVHGAMGSGNRFVADSVLAKHDENYMPSAVAETLAANGGQTAE